MMRVVDDPVGMAPFRYVPDELAAAPDWPLLRHNPITLYDEPELLQTTLSRLKDVGYVVHEFDCKHWNDEAAAFPTLHEGLGLPGPPADNWDPLYEQITDVASGLVPWDGGVAVVLRDLDQWPGRHSMLLDLFAYASRRWLLFGYRLGRAGRCHGPLLLSAA
jgi:hypothetical protein